MALMEWDDTMSVGVQEIDEQHKQLILLINEAYDAVQRNDENIRGDLLSRMREYAAMHFATEEKYMRKYGYQDLEGHKFQHTKFNTDVDNFQKKQLEKANLSQIFVYLSRWLTNHIMEEDMKYAPYMPKPEDSEENQDN